jgi:Nuclease-related domain
MGAMVTTRGKGEGYFTIAGYSAIGEGYRLLAKTPFWQAKAAAVLGLVFAAGVGLRSLTSWALVPAAVVLLGAAAALAYGERVRAAVAASWLKGGHGEQLTARRLARLPDGFHVFHDLKVPGATTQANLDHVVVGPTGVFVVDSKAWSGRIHRDETTFEWFHDGQTLLGHQSVTEWEAREVENALADRGVYLTVRFLWCVHGAAFPTRGGVLVNDGMPILAPRQLVRWLRSRQEDRLDPAQVRDVALNLAGLTVPAVPRAAPPSLRLVEGDG